MGYFRMLRVRLKHALNKFLGLGIDTLEEKIVRMRRVHADLDADIALFQEKCGFGCLKPCGHCCENPMVEATELEMLPLARTLVDEGTAEPWYFAAEQHDFSGRCVFFQSEPRPGSRGHCAVYDDRPLVCRLFNCSSVTDKQGRPRLVVCAPVKAAYPGQVARAQMELTGAKLRVPAMADYAMKAMAVDMELERERFPINMAFKRAVDRVWIHQRFSSGLSS